VADDDRALRERMAALEAEVKADADADRARKEVALAKVREARAQQAAESDELRRRQAALVSRRAPADVDHTEGLGGALELAGQANRVKHELARKPKKGEKSWIVSGVASVALGPVGWLYAGSLREAVPATAAWLVIAALGSKLFALFPFLILPVLMIALPLSGIAGIVYALQYNRHGGRQRLFDREDKPKLPGR
jgi:hypothetical protein